MPFKTSRPSRRRFLARSLTGLSLAPFLSSPNYAQTMNPSDAVLAEDASIRPFKFHASQAKLDDLRRRIAATNWPEKETVTDATQGMRLATMQALARYWVTGYDWRNCEARLQALPQFITPIDGLDIHFVHVRSKHADALPLVINHGWPGSIIEQLKIIDPLVNPTAYGASASDAFHVVIPSMPGYGFSGKPASTGWGPERMGRAWTELMTRLGYRQFVAQGGGGAPSSSTRWACRRRRDCSASTPICPPPFQRTWIRRSLPAR